MVFDAADRKGYSTEFANYTANIIVETWSSFDGYDRTSLAGRKHEVIEKVRVRFWHSGKAIVCRSLRELDREFRFEPPAHAGGFMLSLATRAENSKPLYSVARYAS